eukprot:9171163-Prorocentrum_lima.AAC.1
MCIRDSHLTWRKGPADRCMPLCRSAVAQQSAAALQEAVTPPPRRRKFSTVSPGVKAPDLR